MLAVASHVLADILAAKLSDLVITAGELDVVGCYVQWHPWMHLPTLRLVVLHSPHIDPGHTPNATLDARR